MKRLLSLALLLALPATAEASRYDPYLRIARTVAPDVCWPITVELGSRATWVDGEAALAYPESCRIVVAPDFARWPKQEKCATLAHEAVHLARGDGRHSDNPRSVMYHRYTGRELLCLRFKPRLPRGVVQG